MPDTLHEYKEFPDGTEVFARNTEACCQDCGSQDVLKEYKESPDGTLVYVRDTSVCCGCAGSSFRQLREYREYPDSTLVYVRDTGACCDCVDLGSGCTAHCDAPYPDNLTLRIPFGLGSLLDGFGCFTGASADLTKTSDTPTGAIWETTGMTSANYGQDGYARVRFNTSGLVCTSDFIFFKRCSDDVIHAASNGTGNPANSGGLTCPFALCWLHYCFDLVCATDDGPCGTVTAS